MKSKIFLAAIVGMCLASWLAWGDSLELKNGSLIKGKFLGGNENQISFQVGSSVQQYNLADIVSLKFDPARTASDMPMRPSSSPSGEAETAEHLTAAHPAMNAGESVTIPVGTHISVRTIDTIDSTKNRVGDRFQASLEEPLVVDGKVVVAKGADVYGRLAESKTSGTFTGRSQLRLELTGLVVHGRTVPLVTGEYELTGKSRGESTAKRTIGGAAVGTLIGALAGGGKGAAVGAGVGGSLGAGSEVITKGDQVKVPSESLLDFTLQQEVTIPAPQN